MRTTQTETAVVYTDEREGAKAGNSLGEQIREALPGDPPDALIVFVSPDYDAGELLRAIDVSCQPKLMVGCSSAGEFTSQSQGVGMACAVAIRSSVLKFTAGIGHKLSDDRARVARDVVENFIGKESLSHGYGYSAALVLTDALAGHADELIENLTVLTSGSYQFFGGGAGDNANFRHTQVFCGTEVASDAAVALEILSKKPIGVGVQHGWRPAGEPMRVTEANGAVLVSVNAMSAVEAFHAHAETMGRAFNPDDPIPFFLHNILGIDTGTGYKLRVPLAINPDGSITFAAEIPQGAAVCFMNTDVASARDAAATATKVAVEKLNGCEPKVAIFFDCVATRLRMGDDFGCELDALRNVLGKTQFVGCNTYGQVARTEGQFNGFHNCTAVVCVLPA